MKPDSFLIQLEQAEMLEKKGQNAEAIRLARTLFERNNHHPQALKAATLWARNDNQNPEAYHALAVGTVFYADYEKALHVLDIAIKLKPDYAAAWALVGIIYKTVGDLLLARQYTDKALSCDNRNLQALLNMADLLLEQGDYQAALQAGQNAYAIYPNEATVNSSLGLIHSKMEEHEKALLYHKRAIEAAPENTALHANYLIHLLRLKKYKQARPILDNLYKLFQNRPLDKNLLPRQWQYISLLQIMKKGKLEKAGDMILNSRNMAEIEQKYETLKLVDKTHPTWLFHAKGLKCYTSDWSFFDDKYTYMDWKVTGGAIDILIGCGLDDRLYIRPDWPEITIEGPGLLIGSVKNYYHWIIDYFPRFSILDFFPELRDLPIYMNTDFTPAQEEAIALLGFDPTKIIRLPEKHIAVFKDMMIPFIPGRPMQPTGEPDWMKPNENPMMSAWLRQKLLPHVGDISADKRYFISRANAEFRRCINEAALFAEAQKYGFEKMENEGKSFIDQMKIYAGAEAIIGPHGAGFTNIVFAPEQTKIVELFPMGRRLRYFQTIAEQIGQHYETLEGPITRKFLDKNPDFGDFTLDEAAFAAMLQKNFNKR